MIKEHFVFTDNTSLLNHYIVKGSLIKDRSTNGTQVGVVLPVMFRYKYVLV